ncbi:hypothetical protein BH24CHL5_BH24CHL5_00490 [soil metagenome]
MSRDRMRVSVPSLPLVVQPSAEEVAAFDPPRPHEIVAALPATAADRAAGWRRYEAVVDGWRFELTIEPAARAELRERAARAAAEHDTTSRITLRAQIPGRVVRVWVEPGEAVEQGQRLLAIEAMKMENEIRAPRAGTVEDLRVESGARVEREDELLSLA